MVMENSYAGLDVPSVSAHIFSSALTGKKATWVWNLPVTVFFFPLPNLIRGIVTAYRSF